MKKRYIIFLLGIVLFSILSSGVYNSLDAAERIQQAPNNSRTDNSTVQSSNHSTAQNSSTMRITRRENESNPQKRKEAYAILGKTSKRIQDANHLGINRDTRELLFTASKYIRLAAVAFRSNYYDKAAELCQKANETIDNLQQVYEKFKKIIDEYNIIYSKAKKLHSQLHVTNLSGELYYKVQNARILLNYSDQFFSNEVYNKATEYAKRALTILESVTTVAPNAAVQSETDGNFRINTFQQLDKCRVLLWRTEQNVLGGDIRKDFLKAKGHFLKASHYAKTAKYSESMEELKKAFDILNNIPARINDYNKKKTIAYNALKKANERYEVVQRKQLTGEDLSNFMKAKKLLFSAREFFEKSMFDEALQNSEQSYDILKQL